MLLEHFKPPIDLESSEKSQISMPHSHQSIKLEFFRLKVPEKDFFSHQIPKLISALKKVNAQKNFFNVLQFSHYYK